MLPGSIDFWMISIWHNNKHFLILEVTYFLTCNFEKLMLYVLLIFLIRKLLALWALNWLILHFSHIFSCDSLQLSNLMSLGQKQVVVVLNILYTVFTYWSLNWSVLGTTWSLFSCKTSSMWLPSHKFDIILFLRPNYT